ncbi:MAG TPA: SEC-C domain-containing protein [Acidimicrobiales bacterium]|nr:SEC-C domain-containing protein [Acidimicrobiales bacterium]
MGRTDRCPCGSGKKTSRCCKLSADPGPEELARAELAGLARTVSPVLRACSCVRFDELLASVSTLPRVDRSLAWPLPRVVPAELRALLAAVEDDDLAAVQATLPSAVAVLDTQVGRAHLARAVFGLRDSGALDAERAAAMVVDLASGSPQVVTASVVEAVRAELAPGARRWKIALAVS